MVIATSRPDVERLVAILDHRDDITDAAKKQHAGKCRCSSFVQLWADRMQVRA